MSSQTGGTSPWYPNKARAEAGSADSPVTDSNKMNQVLSSCRKPSQTAGDKATRNITQARSESLGRSLKTVPGPTVEGGQGH